MLQGDRSSGLELSDRGPSDLPPLCLTIFSAPSLLFSSSSPPSSSLPSPSPSRVHPFAAVPPLSTSRQLVPWCTVLPLVSTDECCPGNLAVRALVLRVRISHQSYLLATATCADEAVSRRGRLGNRVAALHSLAKPCWFASCQSRPHQSLAWPLRPVQMRPSLRGLRRRP